MFSERIANHLTAYMGATAYVIASFVLLCVPPLLLSTLALRAPRPAPARGVAIGIGFAVWASLCDLCVPYLGLYPNLPGALVGSVFTGSGTDGTAIGQACIHTSNLVLWPLTGWLILRRPHGQLPAGDPPGH